MRRLLVCLVCCVVQRILELPKKLRSLRECVSGRMCLVLASKRRVPGLDSRSSPRQDLGIGLVFGDRARDQACPPHPAAHSALFTADSPHFYQLLWTTAACGSGSISRNATTRWAGRWQTRPQPEGRQTLALYSRWQLLGLADVALLVVNLQNRVGHGSGRVQPHSAPRFSCFRTPEQRQSQTSDAQHKPYQRGERDGASRPISGTDVPSKYFHPDRL